MQVHLPPKTEHLKVMARAVWTLQIILLLSGCAAIQIAGEVDRGRRAYLEGRPDVALNDFLRAAEQDPGYRYINSILSQGVWTYVGRAYYATGKYSQARQALKKAHSLHKDDYLADLYLGLALAKEDQRQRALQEINAGLTGLRNWLDWVQKYDPDGWLWDPSGDLRREIDKDLALISGREFSWNELISTGEWLGRKFEEEIDLVRKDQFNMEQRDSDDNRDN